MEEDSGCGGGVAEKRQEPTKIRLQGLKHKQKTHVGTKTKVFYV